MVYDNRSLTVYSGIDKSSERTVGSVPGLLECFAVSQLLSGVGLLSR